MNYAKVLLGVVPDYLKKKLPWGQPTLYLLGTYHQLSFQRQILILYILVTSE